MSLYVNGVALSQVTFNGQEVNEIYRNNTLVWTRPGSYAWGNEDEVGDAQWWLDLQAWVRTATPEALNACVGKVKKVSLSETYLGANAVSMRCIGANQDGENTLAFQAAGGLPERISFGHIDVTFMWVGWAAPSRDLVSWEPNLQLGETWANYPYKDSDARNYCNTFYNLCSAHDAIKPVLKGTVNIGAYSNRTSTTAEYKTETVFLLSELELGFDKHSYIAASVSTPENAEATYGYNRPYAYWHAAQTDSLGVMDADGNVTPPGSDVSNLFWTRTKVYNNPIHVCVCKNGVYLNHQLCYYSGYFQPAFVIG